MMTRERGEEKVVSFVDEMPGLSRKERMRKTSLQPPE